jgi:sigma-B regulation protein RsbU (phosphoserine phosphatase)
MKCFRRQAKPMDAMMLCYSDSEGQHRIPLDRERTSIGRSSNQDIVISDSGVSRCHAVILRDDGQYSIIDRQSTHGTFLNGTRIQRSMLKHGDILQLGSLSAAKMQFQEDEKPTLAHRSSAVGLLSSLSELRPPGEPRQPARELEQLNWLLRAARQLNEGGAIDNILWGLLHLTLELTRLERGFVFLQSDGTMHLARGLTADDAIVQEDSTVSRKAMQNAIQSNSRFSVSDTQSDGAALDWPSVMEKGIRGIYCIPLRRPASALAPEQLLGLLYLDSHSQAGTLTEVDHRLLETIATEAATLVNHALLADEELKARKAREELSVAADIHRGLMSITMPELPYAKIYAKTVPCLAIGGDFYDAVALDDCLCVAIADVSGKGVSAAIVAATLQGIIHSQFLAGQSLPEIARQLNHFLCARNVGKYATLVLLKLYPSGELEYINCGHVPPLIIHGTDVRKLEDSNLVVGLISEAEYTSFAHTLQTGERILLPTDGLTEAEDCNGEVFGESGLFACAPSQNVEKILEEVERFSAPHPAQDDCTLVEVKYVRGA